MKSIYLHVHDDAGQEERLGVALDLAHTHGANISCVQTTGFNSYIMTDPFGGMYASTDLLNAAQLRDEEERARIDLRLKGEGVTWDWVHADGDFARTLVSCARLADVLILSRHDKMHGAKPAPPAIVADVIVLARAPVLVVPPGINNFRADGPILIAWNGSIEAAHSLRLTLDFLRLATAVHIVTVSDDSTDFSSAEASRYLARHDIACEEHDWPRENRSVAQTLSAAAAKFGAACIVMGAYGHSRLRETILGGVTRDLLAEATVQLLLAH